MRKTRHSKKESHQMTVNDYIASGNPWPIDLHTVAQWALRTGRASYKPQSQAQMLARELQEAIREEMYEDPQGRKVRKKHAFKADVAEEGEVVQKTFWCDIETAGPDQMRKSFQWRRRQIVGDSKQLKTDVDSYNDNNGHGAYIQLSLNFEPDIVESEQDADYNPPPPPPDEEDDTDE